MIACAHCCRESYYVSAKLPLRPARKERETTDGTAKARSEASRATWGWPTARESHGHGGVIVLSHQKLRGKDARESASFEGG
jgi:hypothetical protein